MPRIAEEEPHRADLADPPDSPDDAVEPGEPDRPEDPGPLQVVEGATQAEARPEYAPTAADEALAARALDLLDKLFSAIESNADDCDRMGDSLAELLTSSRDLIAEGKATVNQPTRSRWFESRMMSKMTVWSERIMKPLQSCMSNERVMAALESLAG